VTAEATVPRDESVADGVPSSATAAFPTPRQLVAAVEAAALRFGGTVAPMLPDAANETIAGVVEALLRRTMRERAFMVRRHMRRALGAEASPDEVDAAVDDAFGSYARYWIETLRLGGGGTKRVTDRFEIDGLEEFVSSVDAGRGCILALPHVGQWEVAGIWVVAQGWELTAVVEQLEPPELFEFFRSLRQDSFGIRVVAADERSVGRTLVSALRNGGVVALLADRDVTGTGIPVEFFGEQTNLPAGPAALAVQTGAPLLPVAVYEEDHFRYRAVVRPPLQVPDTGPDGAPLGKRMKVAALTQELAWELEGLVRRAPQQWHLFQPNWPSDTEALAQFRSRRIVTRLRSRPGGRRPR
jgi:lauroyl/myristoyl acyltransferase